MRISYFNFIYFFTSDLFDFHYIKNNFNILLFQGMQGKKIQQVYYQITPQDHTVLFKPIDGSKMYDKKPNGSFIRKAIYKQPPLIVSEQFIDSQFKLLYETKLYKYVRIYQLYNQQIPLFPEDEQFSSYIEPQQSYNSFMAESGLISYDYLRTLFITQNINKRGFYSYFVKKDGDYYLQYCDDIIPLDKKTQKPLWNLSTKHPWQLLLLKVWLKHCQSFQNLLKTEPFSLLETFGLPEYQAFNFRKQLQFLKNQQVSSQRKKQNIKYFAMNKSDVIILAKTIDSQQVTKIGLVPNFAAYRVLRITKPDQISLYRIYSTLPCYWVGSYSPVLNTQLNKVYNYQMYLDLQRNILLTQEQLTRYFNKFYVVPFQLSEPDMLLTQDCVNLSVYKNKPTWLSFEVKQGTGMIGISIQLPKIRNKTHRYPQFRYFLSKKLNSQRISQSRRFSILTLQEENNIFLQSSCYKWQCYRIDYVQGYHHNACFFCKADVGVYVMFIDAEMDGPINVRFDSFLPITRPQIYFPSQTQIKEIFDSTFYAISQDIGVQATIGGQKSSESICLNNSFDELGYGSISIKTLPQAEYKIAMRVYPEKLRQAGYRIVQHHDQFQERQQIEKNYVLVSSKGRPQIIILQKLDRGKKESTIGSEFPPAGTVEFLRITPAGH